MSRYVLTPEAQQDLLQIRDYLKAEAGVRVARYVVNALIVAFRRLGKNPGLGHRREDLSSDEGLRFWPVFSYLVVYDRAARPLTIVVVIHGKRDASAVLRGRS
jgi:toxin ParE1/3/4